MQKIEVPKETKVMVADTKLERWVKMTAVFLTGLGAMFGVQKMPIINEGTKISEAVQVVKNLTPEELSALQGVQVASLEKQIKEASDESKADLNEFKNEIKNILKENDDRTVKRLDKHGELILNNIKSIARLEALVPKARANTHTTGE